MGKGVLVFAGNPVHLNEVFGRISHAIGPVELFHFGVDEAPAKAAVVHLSIAPKRLGHFRNDPRSTRHVFHSSSDVHITVFILQGAKAVHRGSHPRGAKAIHRFTAYGVWKSSQEQGHTRHVPVVLTRLVGAAHDHVLNHAGIQIRIAVQKSAKHMSSEVIGPIRR